MPMSVEELNQKLQKGPAEDDVQYAARMKALAEEQHGDAVNSEGRLRNANIELSQSRKKAFWATAIAVILFLAGCWFVYMLYSANDNLKNMGGQYGELKQEKDRIAGELNKLKPLAAKAEGLQKQLDDASKTNVDNEKKITDLQAKIAELQKRPVSCGGTQQRPRQQVATPSGTARTSPPAIHIASGEICRLLSDGSFYLRSSPSVILPRGHVVVTEPGDPRPYPYSVRHQAKESNESCDAWRARATRALVN